MTTFLRKLVAAIVALAAPALVLATYLSMRTRLPEPLPVHWNFSGAVDGTAGQTLFLTATLAVSLVLALAVCASVVFARPAAAGRVLAAVTMFAAWTAAGVWLVTAVLAAGAADAFDVALPWYAVVLLVFGPTAVAIATFGVLPGRWQDAGGQSADGTEQGPSSLVLTPGESVMWVDQARSRVMEVAAIVLVAVAVGALLWVPADAIAGGVIAAVICLAVAVLLWWMSRITVRIDERGVHTLWGPLYWPRGRIPLEKIASVRVEDIRPLQWGGWGYRVSRRGTATIVAGGPGLVITRRGQWPDHAITVPHAEEGADVLQALLARVDGSHLA